MNNTIFTLIHDIAEQFKHIYHSEVERHQIAWWLLQALTGVSRTQLIAQQEITLSEERKNTLQKMIHEHAYDLKPLQYMIRTVPFGNLTLEVEPPVLIPRPETEEWCYALIDQLQVCKKEELFILDLCTGSGCIALALAHALPKARVVGTDISEKAITLAQINAQLNKVHNASFVLSDLYKNLSSVYRFDLIVTNPPYISQREWQNLSPMVKKWEDKEALVANDDGLLIIKKIIDEAPAWLQRNTVFQKHKLPQLVIEIGYTQGPVVKKYMQEHSFCDVVIHQDLSGKDRIVVGRLSE